MADRLTDKTALSTAPADGDLIHVVDVSDISANAAGTSKKQTAANFLSRGLTIIQGCIVLARTSSATSTSALAAGDLVIYVDADELLIAHLLAAVTTLPADLRDVSKANLFADLSPSL